MQKHQPIHCPINSKQSWEKSETSTFRFLPYLVLGETSTNIEIISLNHLLGRIKWFMKGERRTFARPSSSGFERRPLAVSTRAVIGSFLRPPKSSQSRHLLQTGCYRARNLIFICFLFFLLIFFIFRYFAWPKLFCQKWITISKLFKFINLADMI